MEDVDRVAELLPKPALARLFEAIAAITDLDDGLTRLELEFDGDPAASLDRPR
jgi:hypothetical protein